MVGLRKYPPVLDEQWFSDLVDFLGGITAESQLCSLKVLLHGAEPNLLSSWQAASDKSKIDAAVIAGVLGTGNIPNLDASKITSGRFPLARLPDAATNKFVRSQGLGADPIYDTLVASDIPNLDTSKITTGRFALARLPDAAINKFIRSQGVGSDPIYDTLVAADIPDLDAAKITTGQFTLSRMPRGALNSVIKGTGTGSDPAYGQVDWGELTGKPSTFPPSAHKTAHTVGGGDAFSPGDLLDATARLNVSKAAALVGVRRQLNLIQGANVILTVTDDPANEKVDVAVSATAGGLALGQVEVDFGPVPTEEGWFTIADSNVHASSHIIGQVAYEAPTGKDLDELEMDDILVEFGAAGEGQLSIYMRGQEGPLHDKFKVNYFIG